MRNPYFRIAILSFFVILPFDIMHGQTIKEGDVLEGEYCTYLVESGNKKRNRLSIYDIENSIQFNVQRWGNGERVFEKDCVGADPELDLLDSIVRSEFTKEESDEYKGNLYKSDSLYISVGFYIDPISRKTMEVSFGINRGLIDKVGIDRLQRIEKKIIERMVWRVPTSYVDRGLNYVVMSRDFNPYEAHQRKH